VSRAECQRLQHIPNSGTFNIGKAEKIIGIEGEAAVGYKVW
jgi:hypothetical protein